MTAAIAATAADPAITASKGDSLHFLDIALHATRSGGKSPYTRKVSPSRSIGCSSQCFAFQRCHQFMSALPGVGCVGASSIAQGAAGTPSTLNTNPAAQKDE